MPNLTDHLAGQNLISVCAAGMKHVHERMALEDHGGLSFLPAHYRNKLKPLKLYCLGLPQALCKPAGLSKKLLKLSPKTSVFELVKLNHTVMQDEAAEVLA